MDLLEDALFIYRRLVCLIYREIRVLKEKNHAELFKKKNLLTWSSYANDGKNIALYLYSMIEREFCIEKIIEPFYKETGFTLVDINTIFSEGDWTTSSGQIYFGGPNWARIVELTLDLQSSIEKNDSKKIERLLTDIETLHHNTGFIIDKIYDECYFNPIQHKS